MLLSAALWQGADVKHHQGSRPSMTRSAALDAIAQQAVDRGFPGVVIVASMPGGGLETGVAGSSDLANGMPMTPTARIHVASTTKAITAAAVLQLVDRGKLSLDDVLADVLPGPTAASVPHGDAITVRHLLLHTSGIYSPNNDRRYLARYLGPERVTRPFWTSEEIVAFAADPENHPLFEPGAGQGYGDINYVLLSLIVQEVAGRPFKAFVRDEIFAPLGMRDTSYLSDDPQAPRARGYTLDSPTLRTFGLDPSLKPDASG